MKCTFCGQDATLECTRDLAVCRSCAIRIGNLAANNPAAVGDIWSAAQIDPDPRFEEFKERVAAQISADDAQSHLHLGQAYLEMGLLLDAQREAGLAVGASAVEIATAGLRILLTAPLLRDGGLARLRERLRLH
jgi:hypothetical protein